MNAFAILVSLIRCELKARYSVLGGWQLSANGAVRLYYSV
jgi:hypothetical protein